MNISKQELMAAIVWAGQERKDTEMAIRTANRLIRQVKEIDKSDK